MAEEGDTGQGRHVAQSEQLRDETVHQRHDAEPERAHHRRENQRRCRRGGQEEIHRDRQRTHNVNAAEQQLFGITSSQPAERIGPEHIEQPDQRQRRRAERWIKAADRKIIRQMCRDEDELQPAHEERERHDDVAGMSERRLDHRTKRLVHIVRLVDLDLVGLARAER